MSWTDEQLTDMFGDDPVEKLAFLTGCHKHSINNSPYDGWIIPDDNLRKFALSIVRECVLELKGLYDREYGLSEAIERLEQHFGVEE